MYPDVLYRWRLEASGPDPVARKREIVNRAVIPAIAETPVKEKSVTYYVSKQPRDPPPVPHTVWLTLMAPLAQEAALRAAVEPHLAGVTVVEFCVTPADPILKPDYAWYRQSLRTVTDVALELHTNGDPHFLGHRGFLLCIKGLTIGVAIPCPELRPSMPTCSPTAPSSRHCARCRG